jgi:hypothetical protein
MKIELLADFYYADPGVLENVRPAVGTINAPGKEVRSANYTIQKRKGDVLDVERDCERERSEPIPGKRWLRDLATTNGSFPIAEDGYKILADDDRPR